MTSTRPGSMDALSPATKSKDILCENVIIYGKCRHEDKGCSFKHKVESWSAVYSKPTETLDKFDFKYAQGLMNVKESPSRLKTDMSMMRPQQIPQLQTTTEFHKERTSISPKELMLDIDDIEDPRTAMFDGATNFSEVYLSLDGDTEPRSSAPTRGLQRIYPGMHHQTVRQNMVRHAQNRIPAGLRQPWSQFTDPANTTVFVGGLSGYVTEDELRSFFQGFGEIDVVEIPPGKGCGFIHFVQRHAAEMAINQMQGYPIGNSRVRLSWGRRSHDSDSSRTLHRPSTPLNLNIPLPITKDPLLEENVSRMLRGIPQSNSLSASADDPVWGGSRSLKRLRDDENSSPDFLKRIKTNSLSNTIEQGEAFMQRTAKSGTSCSKVRFDTISQDRSTGEQSLLLCALVSKSRYATLFRDA